MKRKKIKGMCKYFTLLLGISALFFAWQIPTVAAGSVTLTVDKSQVNVSESFTVKVTTSEPTDAAVPPEVTVTYDSGRLNYESASMAVGGGGGGLITFRGTEVTLTFSGKAVGNAEIKVEAIIDEDGNNKATASQSVAVAASASDASADATLKSLTITPSTISPAFSPDVTQYTVTVSEDVTEVAVDGVTNNSAAKIVAIEGFTNLENGNLASIEVQAEDGTLQTYQFEIVKDGEAAVPAATITEGTIPIADSNLVVNTTYPAEMLPVGCRVMQYNYKEQLVDSAFFDMGNLVLLYLSEADGSNADFYIYYSGSDEFMEFVQIYGIEGKYIFPVQYPLGVPIPNSFVSTTFQWGERTISAYMVSENAENAVDETDAADGAVMADETVPPEAEALYDIPAVSDFYLMFAMSSDGNQGWYLYDTKEGSYQRYLEINQPIDLFDNQSYVTYKQESQTRMVIICILIFFLVLTLLLALNLYLKLREKRNEDGDENDEDDDPPPKKTKPEPNQKPSVLKPSAPKNPQVPRNPQVPENKTAEPDQTDKAEIQDISDIPEISYTPDTSTEAEQEAKPQMTRRPIMVDLSAEAASDRAKDKMAIDDDFEFEFINIDD